MEDRKWKYSASAGLRNSIGVQWDGPNAGYSGWIQCSEYQITTESSLILRSPNG